MTRNLPCAHSANRRMRLHLKRPDRLGSLNRMRSKRGENCSTG